MKSRTYAFVLLSAFLLTGCANTAEGIKQDTEINKEKAAEASQNAAKGAEQAGKDIGAATLLTPAIKTAIAADKTLNDMKNVIDVDSTADKVTLKGHVASAEMKTLAQQITERVIKEKNATQTVDNQLEVKPG